MPGLTSGVLLLGMFAAGKKLGYRDTGEVRRKVERQQTRPKPYGPPKKLDRTCDIALDFRNGWPCYRVSPSGTRPATEVLYLHGGAYIEEIGANHWHLIRQLATDGPAHVTVPLYPLAPRGTARGFVPAATELAASLTERAAGPTVFMGDSAGGGMALALAQRLRDSGRTRGDVGRHRPGGTPAGGCRQPSRRRRVPGLLGAGEPGDGRTPRRRRAVGGGGVRRRSPGGRPLGPGVLRRRLLAAGVPRLLVAAGPADPQAPLRPAR
ncbi:alpha/beta hydrolase fold domain-containing protein [Streptomyces sp. NPDC048845]|uniref:alpha/beta hydrolase n=1 Tax=Streptomyces sp. NPDC048845 TaxID=3155390 RepID=UPI0034360C3F